MKKTILQIKQKYELDWMKIPEVEGVGITKHGSEEVIVIFTSSKSRKLKEKLPDQIEGYKVTIQFSGPFQAF